MLNQAEATAMCLLSPVLIPEACLTAVEEVGTWDVDNFGCLQAGFCAHGVLLGPLL